MPLTSFLHDEDPGQRVVRGKLEQRQTVYNLRQTIVGEFDLYEVIRDLKAQGCVIEVAIRVLSRESQLGS